MRKVVFSDKDIKDIVVLFNSGKSITKISNMYHVNHSRIQKVLLDQNVKIQKKKRKYTHDDIVRMYTSGMSIDQIIEKTKYQTSTIRCILRNKGVLFRGYEDIDKGKIMALARAGWRIKDIVIEMSLPPDTVKRVLVENMAH